MAVFEGSVRSRALGMDTHLTVLLPQGGRPRRTLYLLHGYGDDCTAWARRTGIESYCEQHSVAAVCPEAGHSFYADMACGPRYAAYIGEELPQLAAALFGLPAAPQQSLIAGLSMGGYGALSLALRAPGRYAAAGCFSGVCDIRAVVGEDWGEPGLWRGIFGEACAVPPQYDLYALAERAAGAKAKPGLFLTCGTEDELYGQFAAFGAKLRALRYALTAMEWSGKHEWSFWDKSIRLFLDKFAN